jgi:hypothetical protein
MRAPELRMATSYSSGSKALVARARQIKYDVAPTLTLKND